MMKTKFRWHKPRDSENIDELSIYLKGAGYLLYDKSAYFNRHRNKLNTRKTYKLFTINESVEQTDRALKKFMDRIRNG